MEMPPFRPQRPSVERCPGSVPRRSTVGLTLIEVISVTLICGLRMMAFWSYGPLQDARAVRLGAMFVAEAVIWGSAYMRAPELASNVSVLLFVGFLALGLVSGLLQRSQEEARCIQCENSLRQIGANVQTTGYAQARLPRDRSRLK